MNKSWLPFIFLLSIFEVNGQADNSSEGIIKEKLRKYCQSVPWEETYIHTDRDDYIAGENLWVNIYLIDRQNGILSDRSSIAYFDLINSDNRQIVAKRIRLEKGFGPGHFLLPDTLSTGRYVIRAYTNWMKNFLPYNCFVKELKIYNTLSERTLKGKPEPYGITKETDSKNSSLKAESGIEMKVKKEEQGRTEITLITDDSFRVVNKYKCYLLVQTHGVVNLVRIINLQSETVLSYIPDDVFIPGINQIVIFNSELKPLLEKFIYTPSKETVYPGINSADTFRIRERVSLTFNIDTDESEAVNFSGFSISVAPETAANSMQDMADYLVFGTEFGILPESFRNRRLSEIPADTINRFLQNTKSNWIDWNLVISGKLPSLKYPPENDYHFISGKLAAKSTQLPVKGENVFLSIPGKTATFQYSKTDSTGLFSFSLPLSHDLMDLIIQTENPDIKSSIMIGSSFTEGYQQNSIYNEPLPVSETAYISKWGVNYQVSKIYGIKNTSDSLSPPLLTETPKRFYGKPDIELNIKDYIKLPLMEEVFFELTPGVQLKSKMNTYRMSVADPVTNRIHEKPPVIFIDGVEINNPAVVAGLDPETVEKIDVVKDLYMVGDYMFFGIINIITTSGDFSGIALPESAIRFKYRVIDPVAFFLSPDYSSENSKRSRIPDFRNTLFWNPSIKADSKGKTVVEFWASDIAGSFEICLQGVNSKGIPISLRKTITVR